MKYDDLDFAADAPSDDLSGPVTALWWLAKGGWKTGEAWETAHDLCQLHEGTMAYDWIHALAHWIEGDRFNSDYWYRRAGQQRVSQDAKEEWAHILGQLEQSA